MHGFEETVEDQNVSAEDQLVVEDQRKLENDDWERGRARVDLRH